MTEIIDCWVWDETQIPNLFGMIQNELCKCVNREKVVEGIVIVYYRQLYDSLLLQGAHYLFC